MQTYTVLDRLLHDGTEYLAGDSIALPPEVAALLLEVETIALVDGTEPTPTPEPETEAETESTPKRRKPQ